MAIRTRIVLVALAVVATLAACAGRPGPSPAASASRTPSPSPTPSAIIDRAVDILEPAALLERALDLNREAYSLRMDATVSFGAQTSESEQLIVGADARGTETAREGDRVATMEYVRTGGYVYIKAGDAYWQGHAPSGQVILAFRDRWVRVNPEAFGMSFVADIGVLPELPAPEGTLIRGGQHVIDDQPVMVLVDEADNEYAIAATGAPHLVRFDGLVQGVAQTVIDFSEFDSVTAVIAPPSGEILNYSDFVVVEPA